MSKGTSDRNAKSRTLSKAPTGIQGLDEVTAGGLQRGRPIERRQREVGRKRQALEAQTAALRGQFEAEEEELRLLIAQEEAVGDRLLQNRSEMAHSRKADEPSTPMATNNRHRRMAPRGGRK